ncbi:MAG: DUF6868 family protein [Planctomycetota bacterium]|jgi:hypothetical protein
MDIAIVRTFFMWCTIINAGLLGLSCLVCAFLSDWSYRMNNRMFSISRETFNVAFCCFIGLYKIFIIVFNLVPWIALLIIGQG